MSDTTALMPLSDALQGVARRYTDARRRANEATYEAAAALYEARQLAQDGEWYTFLQATNTSVDLADRLRLIYEEAQRNPRFSEQVAKGWLPQTQAALLARPSTPPEAREAVLDAVEAAVEQGAAPPSKRLVEDVVRSHKPLPTPDRSGVERTPITPTRIEPTPITPTPLTLTPLLPTPALPVETVVEEIATARPDPAAYKYALALCSLLREALVLAETELVRTMGHDADVPAYEVPPAAAQSAARSFVETPATRSAAALLAFSAREKPTAPIAVTPLAATLTRGPNLEFLENGITELERRPHMPGLMQMQATIDEYAERLDDMTYETFAHRLGAIRERLTESAA